MKDYLDKCEVYIQRGVKKIYDDDTFEYVTEFPLSISDRDGYCIDCRGINSFFYKVYVNGEYILMECNDNISYDRYVSLNELDDGYINLFDFINEGVFIGREFVRNGPVITYLNSDCILKDNAYLCSDSKYIVLYVKDNMFLAKYICGYYEEYCIIDCRYINDGMYCFVGGVYDEYRDRDIVYLDIVKQLISYCRKKSKVMIVNR